MEPAHTTLHVDLTASPAQDEQTRPHVAPHVNRALSQAMPVVIDLTADTPPDAFVHSKAPDPHTSGDADGPSQHLGVVPPVGRKRCLPDSLGQPQAKVVRVTSHQNPSQQHHAGIIRIPRVQPNAPPSPLPANSLQPALPIHNSHRLLPTRLAGLQHAHQPGSVSVPASRLQWRSRNSSLLGNHNGINTENNPNIGSPIPHPEPIPHIPAPQGMKRVVPDGLTLPKPSAVSAPAEPMVPSGQVLGGGEQDEEVAKGGVQPPSKKQRVDAGGKDTAGVDHQAAMKAVLENLAVTGDDEIDPPQKSLMISIMRHQRMALAWMVKREMGSTPKGGILADDQGLGKTISTISLIVTNMPDPTTRGKLPKRPAALEPPPETDTVRRSVTPDPVINDQDQLLPGGTLVVCPTTVLHQWHRELCEKVNRQATNFSVHIYHGKDKALSAGQLSRYTVVLTTYGTLGMEAPLSVRQNTSKGGGKKSVNGSTSNLAGLSSHQDLTTDGDKGGTQSTSGGGIKAEDVIKQQDVDIKSDIKSEVKSEVKSDVGYDSSGSNIKIHGSSPSPSGGGDGGGVIPSTGGGGLSIGYGGVEPGGLIRRRGSSSGPGDGGGMLFQVAWHRVVLDEAQTIKNPRTLVSQAVWRLSADHRWCLSGTPIQNSVDDLFSFFKFLRYSPYDDPSSFKSLIKDKIVNNPETGFKLLSVVLQAILLRRTKQTKFNGEPIVNIPPREQLLDACDFTNKHEAKFYSQVQEESRASLEAANAAGGAQQYVNMLYSLLKLRQACNHPWLVKGGGARAMTAQGGPAPTAVQVAAAKKLPAEERLRLLELALHPSAQCPSCQDVPEQAMVTRCGHVYCSDCMATQMEGTGAGQSDEFTCSTCSNVIQTTEIYTPAALQAAQGGGTGAGAGQVKQQHVPGNQQPGATEWVSSTKVDRLLRLLSEVRQRNGDSTPANKTAAAAASNVLAARSKADKALAKTFKSLGPATNKGGPGSSGPLLKDGRRPEKVIVFSQWTGMLDLLEVALKRDGYIFRRLDGTMPIVARERAITDFEQKSEVNILLVSLKAAALGLNLTVANHVVLMDLWWNPTVEEQAIDRAHRIGQKRTVHVTRITIKGTVEERILELQERKRQVISAALCEGGAGATASKLSMEDLRFLFMGVTTTPTHVDGDGGEGASATKASETT